MYNIHYQISNIKYQISNIKYQISNIKWTLHSCITQVTNGWHNDVQTTHAMQ